MGIVPFPGVLVEPVVDAAVIPGSASFGRNPYISGFLAGVMPGTVRMGVISGVEQSEVGVKHAHRRGDVAVRKTGIILSGVHRREVLLVEIHAGDGQGGHGD